MIVLPLNKYKMKPLTVATLFALGVPQIAFAAETAPEAEQAIKAEVITVVGSRVAGRTELDSAVPVDVFTEDELRNQSFSDTNDALRTLVPSFNIKRFDNNEGSSFVRPPTLRGLSPDQTLVLINGKRRHRSALVVLDGTATTRGAQAVDLSKIPMAAVKRLEVLRDGAAAQYGSDAIAGVIQFVLKDANEGGSVNIQTGQFFEGDGEDFKIEGNIGLPLTEDGFINLTASYTDSAKTSRGIEYPAAKYYREELGLQDVPTPAMNWGNPDTNSLSTFFNAGISLDDSTELYAFGNYGKAKSHSGFYYRRPEAIGKDENGVGLADGYDYGQTSVYNDSVYDETPAHPEKWDLRDIYPGGFTPEFSGDLTDVSIVIGGKGELENGFTWDVSSRWAKNEIDYHLDGSINASMGVNSPTSFDLGALAQEEFGINADFTYELEVSSLENPVYLAAGAEYREETYIISLGDEASWKAGPLVDLSVGANGFPGFSPIEAGKNSKDNIALYFDVETSLTDQLLVGMATRYEDYSDFGSSSTGKLSMRYDFSDNFAFRGAVSTGFRAPTAGQQFTTNVSIGLAPVTFDPIAKGTFPVSHGAAKFFGATTLKAEESVNSTFGFVANYNDLNVTVDFYNIKLTDRISLSNLFTVDDSNRQALADAGVNNVTELGGVRYFANAFDTTTKGVDIIATYNLDWDNGSSSNIVLGYNHNSQEVTKIGTGGTSIDDTRILGIEKGEPSDKGSLTFTHSDGDFDYMLRANYYGKWMHVKTNETFGRSGAVLLDAKLTYQMTDEVTLSLGGRNILDKEAPTTYDRLKFGGQYVRSTPYGYNGGFYYLNATYNF